MRRARYALAVVSLAQLAGQTAGRGQAAQGTITGTVTVHRDGQIADASGVLLYVVGFEEKPPKDPAQIHQRNKRFEPDLLGITAGQSVSFPNDDGVFHNVFSASPARKFDLGQYPKGESKTKKFPDVGVVDVFCNIHPEMAATILVLPNRRFARAGAAGEFRLDGVPAGDWTLYAYSRSAPAPVSAPVHVGAGRTTDVSLSLDEANVESAHPNKYGEKYRDPEKYR